MVTRYAKTMLAMSTMHTRTILPKEDPDDNHHQSNEVAGYEKTQNYLGKKWK